MGVRNRLLIGVAIGLAALSSACEVTREERVAAACSSICACRVAPLPALQDRCVADCNNQLDATNASDACLDCVSANSDRCSTLENVCAQICDPPTPGDPQFPDGGI